jgi:hypothetical protein
MWERAWVFEGNDFDFLAFAPMKRETKAVKSERPPEAVRAVSEGANFRSREPAPSPKQPVKKTQRRHRTGRNLQLNVKVAAKTLESFYEITDRQGWVLGETLEKALAALERELAANK